MKFKLFSRYSSLAGGRTPGDAAPVVAAVGALRSGTNYLKFLVECNYHLSASYSAYGWKHAGIPVIADASALSYPDVPVLFIVKNPYAFAVSLHAYYQRKTQLGHRVSLIAHDDFDEFLIRPVVIFDSQLKDLPQMRFANPIQYWNFIYWNLETLDAARFAAIGFNYEDLLRDPGGIRRIESLVPARRISETILVPGNRLRRLDGNSLATAKADYQDSESFDAGFYKDRKYLERFTTAQLGFIRNEVDPWLMARRGYEVI